MKQMTKEEVQSQLESILKQYNQSAQLSSTQSHIQTQMSRDVDNLDELPTIGMKVYPFDVLGSKLYVVTQSDHISYIQEYIDSINSGKPDKDGVIRKYAMEYQKMSESLIDRLLNQLGNSSLSQLPIRIISELNRIELDLKPLLDAQKRDQKITDLLDGGISKNEK